LLAMLAPGIALNAKKEMAAMKVLRVGFMVK
jgi:hypothetical protein